MTWGVNSVQYEFYKIGNEWWKNSFDNLHKYGQLVEGGKYGLENSKKLNKSLNPRENLMTVWWTKHEILHTDYTPRD